MAERYWDDDPDLRAEAERLRQEQEDAERARHASGAAGGGQLAEIRRGGGYQMQKISWLWPGWLARGKLHILGGQKVPVNRPSCSTCWRN
jgi:hypothetical protein